MNCDICDKPTLSFENDEHKTPVLAKYWKSGTDEKGKWSSKLEHRLAVFCSAECSHKWETNNG